MHGSMLYGWCSFYSRDQAARHIVDLWVGKRAKLAKLGNTVCLNFVTSKIMRMEIWCLQVSGISIILLRETCKLLP